MHLRMKKTKHSQMLPTGNTKKNNAQDTVFIKTVFQHYEKNGRHDLIWRKKINAYRILVSEIMLQQTQVSRVIPKFTEWMKRYPTLAKLRESNLQEVLVLWQGLGYQRRAKALYTIAEQVDTLPKTFDELLNFPGIGRYTASAVCAFAYDSFAHPMLETNIRTALIETFHKNLTEINDSVLYTDLLRLEGYDQVHSHGARTWYYALMDYGAYLKSIKVSHNKKSKGYAKQKPYKGSTRELRAKILFAVAKGDSLPGDKRLQSVLDQLVGEGFILKKNRKYIVTP